MKMVIEHFVTFLLLLVFLWIGISYVMQNIIHTSARDYHNQVICQIENSYFSEAVIAQCEEEAKKAGYKLNVERFENGENKDGKVTLTYHYTVPIINVSQDYSIEGYLR